MTIELTKDQERMVDLAVASGAYRNSDLPDLLPHLPAILAALRSLKRGQAVRIG